MPLTVRAWSESSLVALTVGADAAVSALATTISDETDDIWVSGVLALSVTLNPNA